MCIKKQLDFLRYKGNGAKRIAGIDGRSSGYEGKGESVFCLISAGNPLNTRCLGGLTRYIGFVFYLAFRRCQARGD
jgi:hypothetical protein